MVDRTLDTLRHWLLTHATTRDGRVPPERRLAVELELSRAELRKGLASLEAEGRLTRHVGRGTFVVPGALPLPPLTPALADQGSEPRGTGRSTRPGEFYEARLVLEPELSRLAALNASGLDLEAIRADEDAVASCTDWDTFDAADARFHVRIASATGSPLLAGYYSDLVEIGRDIVWGRLRDRGPRPGGSQAEDHRGIVAAIVTRDGGAAYDAARHHVLVEANAALMRLI